MKITCVILFIISVFGCNVNQNECHILTANEILTKYHNRVFIPKGGGDKILQIIDRGIDSAKGGVYYFNKNSCLRKYIFFQNLKAYTYKEEYNENGELLKSKGRVLVDNTINEIGDDSAFINIYLFSLRKQYQKLQIKINDHTSAELPIIDDTLYTNMKMATFGFKTTGLKKINIIYIINYLQEPSILVKSEFDTISLIKNPKLNLDTSIKYPAITLD